MILTIITLILWIIVSIFILLSPVVTKIEYTLCVITLIIELISNIVFRVQINEYKDKYNKAEEFKQQMILENNKIKEQDTKIKELEKLQDSNANNIDTRK